VIFHKKSFVYINTINTIYKIILVLLHKIESLGRLFVMNKFFSFIFCLLTSLLIINPDVSANVSAGLGSGFLDHPDAIITDMQQLAPTGLFNFFSRAKGLIDLKLPSLTIEKSVAQAQFNIANSILQNIKTVQENNSSWLLWLSNWRHHGTSWFNLSSGNKAVSTLNPQRYEANRSVAEQKINAIDTEIAGLEGAKKSALDAYECVFKNYYALKKVWTDGTASFSDHQVLKELHDKLAGIKENVNTALVKASNIFDKFKASEKLAEYDGEGIFGNHTAYSSQSWRAWRYRNLNSIGNTIKTGVGLCVDTEINIVKTLQNILRTNNHEWAIGGAQVIATVLAIRYATKKWGLKGAIGSIATTILGGMFANWWQKAR